MLSLKRIKLKWWFIWTTTLFLLIDGHPKKKNTNSLHYYSQICTHIQYVNFKSLYWIHISMKSRHCFWLTTKLDQTVWREAAPKEKKTNKTRNNGYTQFWYAHVHSKKKIIMRNAVDFSCETMWRILDEFHRNFVNQKCWYWQWFNSTFINLMRASIFSYVCGSCLNSSCLSYFICIFKYDR